MIFQRRNCYNIKVNKKAFTIIEILIAITVILILAAAALSGSGGIIRSMRFNNAFNKMVFMVQRARNLAIAGKNADVEKYAVEIFKNTAALFTSPESATSEILTLPESTKLQFKTKTETGLECISMAIIIFKNGVSEPVLACDGEMSGSLDPTSGNTANTLKITLQELGASDEPVREKTFSINHISGVPQL